MKFEGNDNKFPEIKSKFLQILFWKVEVGLGKS